MSRAGRARKIAAAAAFGGGGIGALGAAAYGLVLAEVKIARKVIGQPFGNAGPGGEGLYGDFPGEPIQLVMLGDSTSVGLGADHGRQTPGAVIAAGLAPIARRPVRMRMLGRVGGQSWELEGQTARALDEGPKPDVVVIMVGANDVTHRVKPQVAVRALEASVRKLREAGVEVVVGTCPDLGTIQEIPRPLRYVAQRLSRQLAAAQTIGVVEAGGATVSLADLLGDEFRQHRVEMFASDRFHPSPTGYARVAEAILPSVATVLGYPAGERDRVPDLGRGEGIDDVAHAAVRAVDTAGTEVSGIEVSGAERGPRGRWAAFRRRRAPQAAAGGHEVSVTPGESSPSA
ncbi:SGNH/GDSL hydrolase family protein [Kineosporia sp. J2-2]|uniref:SGNH/GDSL hydrolase family protein n=1 Tax=Kineosporia corallincola TaxID=2835133 RepID=A0ABS5TJF1_9ACTN|nr:SGNH/GDSL hydrolase family protein [Kineosporia corallincola]MBT0770519.1 SGNH/GDSL hydrolase family protein [Kineosporia corallincola]